jgi:N-methylhydantoinase A
LNVPYTRNVLGDFRSEHQRRYGYNYPAREMELVTLRLRATIKSQHSNGAKASTPGHVGTGAFARPGRARSGHLSSDRAPVSFSGKKLAAAILSRNSLPIGKKYFGPAVVTEYSATTVIRPGMSFQRDRAGNLIVEIRAVSRRSQGG